MSQTILHQILEQLKTLDPVELQQVSRAIQIQLSPQAASNKRRAFYKALRTSGLVRQFKSSSRFDVAGRRFVQVNGKPVSQTIIEERR